MTRCLRSKIFTTYLFGQNYLGKMMSNILPTIKLALKLEVYIIHEFSILFIDHLNDLDALSSVDLTLLSFRSNVYYVDENRVHSYYVLST